MSDALLVAGCLLALAAALTGCVLLRRRGVAATHVRDLLHVGAGAWVLGWRWWRAPLAPTLLVAAVAAATALVPFAARRLPAAARVHNSVTGGDERWSGLVGYTLAFAVFTAVGLYAAPLPAASALLALALGDGIGGAVGRRFGRIHYRLPWAKQKSLEGSITVAVMAAVGALAAAAWLGVPLSLARAVVAGGVAAVVEAAAPRSSDNLLIPAAVFAVLVV